jgi:hypothetical protein
VAAQHVVLARDHDLGTKARSLVHERSSYLLPSEGLIDGVRVLIVRGLWKAVHEGRRGAASPTASGEGSSSTRPGTRRAAPGDPRGRTTGGEAIAEHRGTRRRTAPWWARRGAQCTSRGNPRRSLRPTAGDARLRRDGEGRRAE